MTTPVHTPAVNLDALGFGGIQPSDSPTSRSRSRSSSVDSISSAESTHFQSPSSSASKAPSQSKGFIFTVCDQIYRFLANIFDWICSFFITSPECEEEEPPKMRLINELQALKIALSKPEASDQLIISTIEAMAVSFLGFKDRLLVNIEEAEGAGSTYLPGFIEQNPKSSLVIRGVDHYLNSLNQ
ncbi:MAG: hypothetical protein EBZ47_03805 [Chlamydiae bacterium]|nr:hypothetical protein [Chlamydiota bacterium]